MKQKIILDTGSLVASIDKSDRFHNWAKETWKTIPIPLFTCEAVICEAGFLSQILHQPLANRIRGYTNQVRLRGLTEN